MNTKNRKKGSQILTNKNEMNFATKLNLKKKAKTEKGLIIKMLVNYAISLNISNVYCCCVMFWKNRNFHNQKIINH